MSGTWRRGRWRRSFGCRGHDRIIGSADEAPVRLPRWRHMKGIFTTKVIPEYDDLPEPQYHFPSRYLKQAERCVGDWMVLLRTISLNRQPAPPALFGLASCPCFQALNCPSIPWLARPAHICSSAVAGLLPAPPADRFAPRSSLPKKIDLQNRCNHNG